MATSSSSYSAIAEAAGNEAKRALAELIDGYRSTQLVYTAVQAGVIDRLAEGPRTTAELADATASDPDVLERLLAALEALAIVARGDGDLWKLGPLGPYLRSEDPEGLRAKALLSGGILYRAWGEFSGMLASSPPAFERAFGSGFFTFLARYPHEAGLFARVMSGTGRRRIDAVMRAYDFSRFHTIVDVGGGDGTLLAALLAANPTARGILLEQSTTAARARAVLRREAVADRCDVVEGDFFASVPAGGDAYVLSRVVSDWDDERCFTLLRNCREAMGRSGVLVVVTRVLSEEASRLTRLLDLHLLVLSGGRERSERELRALLECAGLSVLRFLPTEQREVRVIEAVSAI